MNATLSPPGLFSRRAARTQMGKRGREAVRREVGDWMEVREYTQGQRGARRHKGQLKLLLSEIEFLTEYAAPGAVVVYAGTADGYHVPLLGELFPQIAEWHLWDPEEFAANVWAWADANPSKVFVHPEYFTDEDASRLAQESERPILFVSDVRTDAFNEESIRGDMAAQLSWVRATKARASLVKFRLPYPRPGEDPVFEYVKCRVMLQVFAPVNSTECRGIIPRETAEQTVAYDTRLHESRMAWFNTVLREKHDYDGEAEAHILSEYTRLHGGPGDLRGVIEDTMGKRAVDGVLLSRRRQGSVSAVYSIERGVDALESSSSEADRNAIKAWKDTGPGSSSEMGSNVITLRKNTGPGRPEAGNCCGNQGS